MRIPPDRPGYTGYGCSGITPVDIGSSEPFLLLPTEMCGSSIRIPWEDLIDIADDPEFINIRGMCVGEYDPFRGIFIDMAAMFVRQGHGDLLQDGKLYIDGLYDECYGTYAPFIENCASLCTGAKGYIEGPVYPPGT